MVIVAVLPVMRLIVAAVEAAMITIQRHRDAQMLAQGGKLALGQITDWPMMLPRLVAEIADILAVVVDHVTHELPVEVAAAQSRQPIALLACFRRHFASGTNAEAAAHIQHLAAGLGMI